MIRYQLHMWFGDDMDHPETQQLVFQVADLDHAVNVVAHRIIGLNMTRAPEVRYTLWQLAVLEPDTALYRPVAAGTDKEVTWKGELRTQQSTED